MDKSKHGKAGGRVLESQTVFFSNLCSSQGMWTVSLGDIRGAAMSCCRVDTASFCPCHGDHKDMVGVVLPTGHAGHLSPGWVSQGFHLSAIPTFQ